MKLQQKSESGQLAKTTAKCTFQSRLIRDTGTSTIERDVENVERPKLYYGWVMLLLAIASSPGQTFGVSIFIEPMRLELGLTHGQMGLAYTLGTLFGEGPILWIGHQVDRRGLRRVALAVVVAFGLPCCLMGLAQNWIQVVFCIHTASHVRPRSTVVN